ncbi:MAG: VWA domain-containing protein, partial [Myxococcales bacterium]|nr:VWA domain-containing protein [Myxococcales bacterium]
VVDLDASFVEAPMGPGASNPPVLEDSPPPPPPPPPPGVHSHPQAGVAVARGSLDGLAAVAPAADCDDPTLSKKRQLDVVFVVDVSTTMGFLLDRLEKQLAQVDREARAQGLDTRYGLVVFVDDVLLANQGQPFADLAAVQAELAHWQAFTASNRQINSTTANVDWPENSLDALHTAATGFAWRPADTTRRMVVHATDDDFGEAPAVQSGLAVQHTYLEVVAALRAAEVRMFSFAAKIGGQCECLDVRPGLFTRHRGRASLPDATGGAVFDIDEVASGKLGFAAAVAGAIKSGVCTRYPLSPFGKSPPAAAAPSPGQ